MREAWWMPMIELPTDIVPTGRQLLTYERTLPGAIMVNKEGKRSTDEASNSNAFGAAFHEQDTTMGVYRNRPSSLVFDQTWLDKYGFGGIEKARTDWITSGDVISGLYAAGNAMASPPGMTYGGAGGTLGPAIVFGHLAGRDIAQRVATQTPPALASA